ncbi:MAG: hypothetical protein FWG63_00890 [Defluviitaleaceae bacterium]|nr:hypothetical protein [Defluviitaleaceae bacterium]
MDTFNNKTAVFLVSGIMAFVATAFVLIVPITTTFVTAYVFALVAIAMFCAGNLYMLSSTKSYPWFVAFPKTIWQYLIVQLALSAIFVIREIFFEGLFPVGVFAFLHILLLAVFAVKLILIKSAKEIIEAKDTEIEQKVFKMRLMQANVESILRNNPEHEKPLRKVIEALKYSDPMSHASVSADEEEIHRNIHSMMEPNDGEPINIPAMCEKLLVQIADRNSSVKLLK